MDFPRLVKTQITIGELDPPADLITGVNNGKVQLLEVVKALGEYLTSVEDGVRLKGLTFLSNLIKTTTPTRINRPATVTLTPFFSSSLDDFDSLPPSLHALLVLSKLPTFDDDASLEVYRAVCDNVNMKAYTQVTRNLVYQLFDSFLASHRNALKSMGADFLNSYTKMVDGEKDPRNLLLLFAMDRVILLEFDISQMVEEFFDITFCYFPISFRPPPNDPYGITADDLKEALRKCMAATPLFAKMAIPLFLEKFVSAAGPAMKDLMLTMGACFPVYGAEVVGERGTELWEAIKVEILYQSDKGIEAASLAALEALMRTLYPKPRDIPTGLAQDVVKECLKLLEEPEKSTSLAATKALVAMFNSTSTVGSFTISQALPHMFRQFNHPAHPSHRTPILWSLTSLLIAASKLYGTPGGARQYSHERPFEQYREALMDTLREGLRTTGLKEAAARGCVALSEIPGMWSRAEVEEVVKGMDDIVLNEADSDIRKAVLKSVVSLSQTYPSIIESSTLPLLFHSLPDSSPPIPDTSARDKYRSVLSSLSDLCVLPALFETLLIRILNKLDLVASNPGMGEQRECEVAYSFDLLNCLFGVIVKKIEAKHVDVNKHFDTIIPRVTRLVVEASKGRIGSDEPVWRDKRLLALVGRVIDRLMWELPIEKQARYFAQLYAAFEKGEVRGIFSGSMQWTAGSPLRPGAPSSEQNLIVIYSSAIQSLKPDTSLPFTSPADFLAKIIHWTIHLAPSPFHQHYALEMITAFVNKRYTSEGMFEALEGMSDRIWVGDLQDSEKEEGVRKRALAVFLHMTRALALVRHPLAYSSVERVTDILKLSYYDPVIVGEAARGLGVVAKGKREDKASHLTAKLLWAQKMWNFALPKLMEGDADAKGRERLVYLSAFASLLPLVPASLLASDLPNILPLMIRTLSLPSPAERAHAITSLESLLETSNASSAVDVLVHKHAEVIVEGLLKSVGKVPGMVSSAAVRGNTLKCLTAVPDAIRFETLSTVKPLVLRELGKALDDPVRSVRWEAVECRARWYKYK